MANDKPPRTRSFLAATFVKREAHASHALWIPAERVSLSGRLVASFAGSENSRRILGISGLARLETSQKFTGLPSGIDATSRSELLTSCAEFTH